MNSRQTLKLLLGAAVFALVFKMLWSRSAEMFGHYGGEESYEEGEFEAYDETEAYGHDGMEAYHHEGMDNMETYDDAEAYEHEGYADEEAYGDETETYADISATAAPKASKALTQVATDLLPRRGGAMTGGDNWGEFAPKNALKNQNFLDAKKFIGVDTQGSALKNANYDIRSSMPIPKSDVGPWMGSSVDPDLMRRPLE